MRIQHNLPASFLMCSLALGALLVGCSDDKDNNTTNAKPANKTSVETAALPDQAGKKTMPKSMDEKVTDQDAAKATIVKEESQTAVTAADVDTVNSDNVEQNSTDTEDTDQIKAELEAVFAQYNELLGSEDPSAAYELLDANTYSYFADIADHAKYSSYETLQPLPMLQQAVIGLTRVKALQSNSINELDAKQVFTQDETGIIRMKNNAQQATFNNITIEGNIARVNLTQAGAPDLGLQLQFSKEADGWKINLGDLLTQIFAFMQTKMPSTVTSPDSKIASQILVRMINQMGKTNIDESILAAPLAKP